jgi:hypothetical protein
MARRRVDRERGAYKVIVMGHVGVHEELKDVLEENRALAADSGV